MQIAMDAWFQSLMVQPPRICGLQIRPFSLIHEYTLRKLKSPYAVGGAPNVGDLLLALQICARDYRGIVRLMAGDFKPGKAILWAWWIKRRYGGFDTAQRSFLKYMANYSELPEHLELVEVNGQKVPSGVGESVRAPWEFHLVRTLCHSYRMNHEEAWNCPLSLAKCDFDCWSESNGDKTLVSEYQHGLIAEAAGRGAA